MPTFRKQPADVKDYTWDWTAWMPEGDSILTATVTADAGVTLGAKVIAGNLVQQFISGGTDGGVYKITCTMTTTQGRRDERDITLYVIEI